MRLAVQISGLHEVHTGKTDLISTTANEDFHFSGEAVQHKGITSK